MNIPVFNRVHTSTQSGSIFHSKKSPTGSTERTPQPECLIALYSNLLFTGSVGIRSHSIFDGSIAMLVDPGVYPSLKLTCSPLKMDGKGILSPFLLGGNFGLFSGANLLLVSGRGNRVTIRVYMFFSLKRDQLINLSTQYLENQGVQLLFKAASPFLHRLRSNSGCRRSRSRLRILLPSEISPKRA